MLFLTALYLLLLPRQPSPTLFPYTTLFRSGLVVAPDLVQRLRVVLERLPQRLPALLADLGRRVFRAVEPIAVDRHLRSEEHTSELQSHVNLVCRLLLEKKKTHTHPLPPSNK